jgi:hypothetical protein
MALTKIKSSNITTDTIVATDIASGGVGAAELAGTLNLSAKTITLPAASVTPHVPAAPVTSVNGATGVVTISTGAAGIVSTANATAITIDSSENVGIGVTPKSTWGSDFSVLQLGGSAALWGHSLTAGYLSQNVYNDGGYKYLSTSGASLILMNYPGIKFRTAASGTADTAITWNTGFEVLSSGKARAENGLLFGSDTAAANALDDYEEGTWTPTCSVGTMSGAEGRYTKIGNRVYIDFNLANFSNKTSSAEITVGGLPYSISTTPHLGTGTIYQVNNHGSGIQVRNENSNNIRLYDNSNPSGWNIVQYNDLGTDPNFALSGSYINS